MNTTDSMTTALSEAWNELQKTKPGLRIREAARELNSSEASLLATRVGKDVIRLHGPWPALLQRLPALGRVMSLTRNNSVILEHKGIFEKVQVFGEGHRSMATVLGPIETRVFFSAWFVAFAVIEEKSDRVLKSIQIFDKSGEAITKIYLQEKGEALEQSGKAFQAIVKDLKSDDQNPEQETTPYAKESFNTDIDAKALLADWSALKDTHDFFGMLRKHNVDRHHALSLASGAFTYTIDPITSPKAILDEASKEKLPIMIFAGNRGNLQIHQDIVRTIRVLDHGHANSETWLNVLDPDFNLHMKQNDVHTAWVVRKPTSDGVVTSVECFDKEKNLIVQFFGLRKPGAPELDGWKTLVSKLSPAK